MSIQMIKMVYIIHSYGMCRCGNGERSKMNDQEGLWTF